MKNLTIGICEQSEKDRALFIQYLKIAETALEMEFQIDSFDSGKALIRRFRPIYHLLFISLPLADVDTRALLNHIRQQDAFIHIVLISENSLLYPLGYEYDASNYYTKPLCYSRFFDESKKCLRDEALFLRPYIWISNQHEEYKLYLYKLRYIETTNRYLCFHYENRTFLYHGKISDFEKSLSEKGFFRCNNSYLVNLHYIENIRKDYNRHALHLITGEKLPLSRDKKGALVEKLEELCRSKLLP